jgi:hypothetical protein
MSPKLYRRRADRLKFETFKLAGLASVSLPDSASSGPQLAHLVGPVLQAIARQIDEVLCAFDELEECLEVAPEAVAARFGAPLGDGTTIPAGEAGGHG